MSENTGKSAAARNEWQLNRAKQDYPALQFLQTREQAPLTQAAT